MTTHYPLIAVPAALILALALGCKDPTAPRPGEPFSLRVGEAVSLGGSPDSLRFVEVTQDSRCPRDVVCVWAGDGVVRLQLFSAADTTDAYLHTNSAAGPTRAAYRAFTLELTGLEPIPESGKPIPRDGYTAQLRFYAAD